MAKLRIDHCPFDQKQKHHTNPCYWQAFIPPYEIRHQLSQHEAALVITCQINGGFEESVSM